MSFDEKVLETSNKTGFFIGPTFQLAMPMGLGVDISGLYDQKETKVNEETIKQQSILIPVNLRYKVGLGSQAGIYLAAGPQFGFNVGDDKYTWNSVTDISGTKEQINNEFQLKKSSFSVNLGAGVYLTKHIEVGFQYNIPLGKTADATVADAISGTAKSLYKSDDTKVKTWSISAALFF
jgi:opacity protein-like surface antigen